MPKKEALNTRDAILAGEQVKITVPPRANLKEPSPEWKKVLGAFAASYTFTPPESGAGKLQENNQKKTVLTPEEAQRIGNIVFERLDRCVGKKSLANMVEFSAPSRLLQWADGQITDKAFYGRTVSAEDAPSVMAEELTERGIVTFARDSIDVAVLLTELLSSSKSQPRTPDSVRQLIIEHGYRLIVPGMKGKTGNSNPTNNNLLCTPRNQALFYAKSVISTTTQEDGAVLFRWSRKFTQTADDIACPYLLAQKGKAVKPAFKLVVDTIWDTALDWRVRDKIVA